MTASAWIHALGQKPECWYSNMVDSYPEQLCQMYATLRRMAEEGKVYGFFLELRDIYEGLIRWYVLTGIAYAECLGEKKLVALLCDPERSMSFGDWVNVFPRCLAKHLQIGNSPLGKLLAALEKQYNKEGIVRWRNEAIGHGALQQDTSEIFQGVLEEKLYALKKYLEDNATLAQQIVYYKEADGTLQCTVDSVSFRLEPFIRVVDGDYRLFDSMTDKEKQSLCLELSYQTGRRTTVNLPYLFELRSRYYGNAPVTGTDSFDEEVYTDQIEAALRFYHDPGQYWKQPYYTDWLTKCLAQHSKGVFLLQAESGTGKSTFCRHLDGFGRSALKKQGFVCRAYYFSRLSFRTKQEFVNTLCDMFSQVPENEDRLRGKLHTLSHDGDPKDCGAMSTPI